MSIEYDKTTDMVMRLGTALVRAISEHGAPNSFGFSELVGNHEAMFAGRAVRRRWGAFCLNVHARLPNEYANASINLSGGRLHVEIRESRKDRP